MTDTQHLGQAAIYAVNIAREPDGTWTADVPALEGAHTYARSRDQLDANVREVIALAEDLPDGAEAELNLTYERADS